MQIMLQKSKRHEVLLNAMVFIKKMTVWYDLVHEQLMTVVLWDVIFSNLQLQI